MNPKTTTLLAENLRLQNSDPHRHPRLRLAHSRSLAEIRPFPAESHSSRRRVPRNCPARRERFPADVGQFAFLSWSARLRRYRPEIFLSLARALFSKLPLPNCSTTSPQAKVRAT